MGSSIAEPQRVETILFLCPHGAAKSVLAAALFQQLADRRGLALRAICAGTEPDPAIPAPVADYLRRAGLPLPGPAPRLVTDEDLHTASWIVSFECELSAPVPHRTPVLHWDDVPPVSQDFLAATMDIRVRVERLIAEIAAAADSPSDSHSSQTSRS